jgi:hypothetical protein
MKIKVKKDPSRDCWGYTITRGNEVWRESGFASGAEARSHAHWHAVRILMLGLPGENIQQEITQ